MNCKRFGKCGCIDGGIRNPATIMRNLKVKFDRYLLRKSALPNGANVCDAYCRIEIMKREKKMEYTFATTTFRCAHHHVSIHPMRWSQRAIRAVLPFIIEYGKCGTVGNVLLPIAMGHAFHRQDNCIESDFVRLFHFCCSTQWSVQWVAVMCTHAYRARNRKNAWNVEPTVTDRFVASHRCYGYLCLDVCCLWHCCDNGKYVCVRRLATQIEFTLRTNSWMSADSCSMLNFTIRWPAAAEREFLQEVTDIISIYLFIFCERKRRRCSLLAAVPTQSIVCDVHVMRAWRRALTTLNNWNGIRAHLACFRLCCARPYIYTALAHS